MKSLLSLVVHLAILPSCLGKGKCYYPNGKEATSDFPCDPDAEHSVCCSGDAGFASACLSNKLCQSTSGRIIRGACTDPTWMSPECPRYCLNWDVNGWDMVPCSNVTQRDTSYCCNTMKNCCDGGIGRFEVLPPNPDTWALWNAGKGQYVVVTPLSKAASSSSAISSATSAPQSSKETTSSASRQTSATDSSTSQQTSATDTSASPSRSQPPSTETAASGQTATTQPSSAESGSSSSSGLSTAAQAGIGVGAAVGALLVAAVAYLWWKLRKTQQAAKAENAQWQDPQDPYTYPTQNVAQPLVPPYAAQDPRRKYELQGYSEAHELQGQHYYVQGDASSAEMMTQPSYAAESPVTAPGTAR